MRIPLEKSKIESNLESMRIPLEKSKIKSDKILSVIRFCHGLMQDLESMRIPLEKSKIKSDKILSWLDAGSRVHENTIREK